MPGGVERLLLLGEDDIVVPVHSKAYTAQQPLWIECIACTTSDGLDVVRNGGATVAGAYAMT